MHDQEVLVGEMPYPKTGTSHYHAESILPDNICGIKGSVVCNGWNVIGCGLEKGS